MLGASVLLYQHQQGGIASPDSGGLMESLDMGVLGEPERDFLLEDVLAMAMHDAGAADMLAAAGLNQRGQFELGLLLGQAMQIQQHIGNKIAPA